MAESTNTVLLNEAGEKLNATSIANNMAKDLYNEAQRLGLKGELKEQFFKLGDELINAVREGNVSINTDGSLAIYGDTELNNPYIDNKSQLNNKYSDEEITDMKDMDTVGRGAKKYDGSFLKSHGIFTSKETKQFRADNNIVGQLARWARSFINSGDEYKEPELKYKTFGDALEDNFLNTLLGGKISLLDNWRKTQTTEEKIKRLKQWFDNLDYEQLLKDTGATNIKEIQAAIADIKNNLETDFNKASVDALKLGINLNKYIKTEPAKPDSSKEGTDSKSKHIYYYNYAKKVLAEKGLFDPTDETIEAMASLLEIAAKQNTLALLDATYDANLKTEKLNFIDRNKSKESEQVIDASISTDYLDSWQTIFGNLDNFKEDNPILCWDTYANKLNELLEMSNPNDDQKEQLSELISFFVKGYNLLKEDNDISLSLKSILYERIPTENLTYHNQVVISPSLSKDGMVIVFNPSTLKYKKVHVSQLAGTLVYNNWESTFEESYRTAHKHPIATFNKLGGVAKFLGGGTAPAWKTNMRTLYRTDSLNRVKAAKMDSINAANNTDTISVSKTYNDNLNKAFTLGNALYTENNADSVANAIENSVEGVKNDDSPSWFSTYFNPILGYDIPEDTGDVISWNGRESNDLKTEDWLRLSSIALDLTSLVGGAVGTVTGLSGAATGSAADWIDPNVDWKSATFNSLVNLGFGLASTISGLGSLKIARDSKAVLKSWPTIARWLMGLGIANEAATGQIANIFHHFSEGHITTEDLQTLNSLLMPALAHVFDAPKNIRRAELTYDPETQKQMHVALEFVDAVQPQLRMETSKEGVTIPVTKELVQAIQEASTPEAKLEAFARAQLLNYAAANNGQSLPAEQVANLKPAGMPRAKVKKEWPPITFEKTEVADRPIIISLAEDWKGPIAYIGKDGKVRYTQPLTKIQMSAIDPTIELTPINSIKEWATKHLPHIDFELGTSKATPIGDSTYKVDKGRRVTTDPAGNVHIETDAEFNQRLDLESKQKTASTTIKKELKSLDKLEKHLQKELDKLNSKAKELASIEPESNKEALEIAKELQTITETRLNLRNLLQENLLKTSNYNLVGSNVRKLTELQLIELINKSTLPNLEYKAITPVRELEEFVAKPYVPKEEVHQLLSNTNHENVDNKEEGAVLAKEKPANTDNHTLSLEQFKEIKNEIAKYKGKDPNNKHFTELVNAYKKYSEVFNGKNSKRNHKNKKNRKGEDPNKDKDAAMKALITAYDNYFNYSYKNGGSLNFAKHVVKAFGGLKVKYNGITLLDNVTRDRYNHGLSQIYDEVIRRLNASEDADSLANTYNTALDEHYDITNRSGFYNPDSPYYNGKVVNSDSELATLVGNYQTKFHKGEWNKYIFPFFDKGDYYKVISSNPNGIDRSTSLNPTDKLFSEITNHRTLLGKEEDFTNNPTLLKQVLDKFAKEGWDLYLDDKTKYYKLRRSQQRQVGNETLTYDPVKKSYVTAEGSPVKVFNGVIYKPNGDGTFSDKDGNVHKFKKGVMIPADEEKQKMDSSKRINWGAIGEVARAGINIAGYVDQTKKRLNYLTPQKQNIHAHEILEGNYQALKEAELGGLQYTLAAENNKTSDALKNASLQYEAADRRNSLKTMASAYDASNFYNSRHKVQDTQNKYNLLNKNVNDANNEAIAERSYDVAQAKAEEAKSIINAATSPLAAANKLSMDNVARIQQLTSNWLNSRTSTLAASAGNEYVRNLQLKPADAEKYRKLYDARVNELYLNLYNSLRDLLNSHYFWYSNPATISASKGTKLTPSLLYLLQSDRDFNKALRESLQEFHKDRRASHRRNKRTKYSD